MNRKSPQKKAIAMAAVVLSLSACGAPKPVQTPTPANTPTTAPTSTFTLTSLPTSTPTNIPEDTAVAPGTVTDIDGNIYHTVAIGTQVWMVENLKVTRFRNGDPIPNVLVNVEWDELSSGAYCEYDNDPANVETYGRLYNWYAVDDPRGLAPAGWHVPTDEEWETLGAYLGGNAVAGGKLKEAGLTHWNSPNRGADNSSGFSGLPGGIRASADNLIGEFNYLGLIGAFWASTELNESEAWMRFLTSYDGVLTKAELPTYKSFGYSVRCIMD